MNKAELIKALAELLADKMEMGEEPTNGEVIQAVISELKPIVLSNETGAIYFDWDWWNAPYKRGDE